MESFFQTNEEFFLRQFSKQHFKEHLSTGALPRRLYLLKVNNENIRVMCEICSNMTINTLERRHWLRFGVYFELISLIVLAFPFLNLRK